MKYLIGYKEKESIHPLETTKKKNIFDLVSYTTQYSKIDFIEELLKEGLIPNENVELCYISQKNENIREYEELSQVFYNMHKDLFDISEIRDRLYNILLDDDGIRYFYADQIRNSKHFREMLQYINDIIYNEKNLEGFLLGLENNLYSDKLRELTGELLKKSKKAPYSEIKSLRKEIINELMYNNPLNLILLFQSDISSCLTYPLQYEVNMIQKIYNNQDNELTYEAKVDRWISSVLYKKKNGQFILEDGKRVVNERNLFNIVINILNYQKYLNELMAYYVFEEEQVVHESQELQRFDEDVEDEYDEYLIEDDFKNLDYDLEDFGYKKRRQ